MTTTDHRTLGAYEDAEQAHALSWPDVTLYLDEDRVLIGPHRGRDVWKTLEQIVWGHIDAGREASWEPVTLRPWWRLWRPTRAIRITVRAMAGGFEQAYDDGGPE